MDLEEARKRVKQQLTEKRYEHTLRVCDTAVKLARRYGESTEKAYIASLFHDYAKCLPQDQLKHYIEKYQLPIQLLDYHHELWHGPVGSKLVAEHFHITDQDILNAIYYHTTGRAKMSKLEFIVFVSDYIEPGRSFPGLEEVREVAQNNLEYAAQLTLRNSMMHLLRKHRTIYPDTVFAYNELTKKGVVNN